MTVDVTVATMTDMRHLLTAAILVVLIAACGPDEVIPPDWYVDADLPDDAAIDACGTMPPDGGVDAVQDAEP